MAVDPMTAKAIASGALGIGRAVGGKSDDNLFTKVLHALAAVAIAFCLLVAALLSLFTLPVDMENSALWDFAQENREEIFPVNVSYEQIGEYPMPCNSSAINSPFGERTHPVNGGGDFHTGIDFATSYRSPIVAIAEGTVKKTGVHKAYGRFVSIQHRDFTTFYAHLSAVYAVSGLKVSAGDVIGLEGGDPTKDVLAGTSTGHHLHFEIREGLFQKQVDPYDYILKPPEDEEDEDNDSDDEDD